MSEENKELHPTQGGGYCEWDEENKRWVFVIAPEDFPEIKVGDFVPTEWGII